MTDKRKSSENIDGSKVVELIRKTNSKLAPHWDRLLAYHMSKAAGRGVDIYDLALKDPKEFRELFIKAFGEVGWELYKRVLLRTASEMNLNPIGILALFEQLPEMPF